MNSLRQTLTILLLIGLHPASSRQIFAAELIPGVEASSGTPVLFESTSTAEDIFGGEESLEPMCCAHAACCTPRTLFGWSPEQELEYGTDFEEPLVTDRPDFTEASSTVGLGVTQIEFGYTYTYNSDSGTSERTHSFGEPLLRHGIVANWLELRVGLFPVEQRTKNATTSNTTAGTEDLYLGLKIGLTPQAGILPEMALIPQMTVPTGSNAFTNDEVLPGVNWIYSWELSDCLSTAGSTQFNRAIDGGSGDTYTEWAQSWTVAMSLTEQLGAYTEWYALFPSDAETERVEHYLNGGFTWLINNDVQFDIRAGWGLNGAADDFFAGSGFSLRFH